MSNFCGRKLPISFKKIILRQDLGIFENTEYLAEISELYKKFSNNLEDDFSLLGSNIKEFLNFAEKISPHLYAVFYKDNFCGFITLENLTGQDDKIHSAEVSICLKRKYWGNIALYVAKIFKYYCFNVLKITKLKALIYPQNKLVKNLLYKCGFKKEAVLKAETVRNGNLQDIDVYTLFKKEGGCNAV